MKKIYPIIFISFLVLAIISGCINTSKVEYEKPKLVNVNISVWQGKEMTEASQLFILDVRTQEEYNSGHIKNAVLIPLKDLNEENLKNITKDKNILVYSSDGQNSSQASEILIKNGFMQVYNMADGIGAWIDAGYEVVK